LQFSNYYLYPPFPPEVPHHHDEDRQHHRPEDRVAPAPLELGHVPEIHPVHAREKGQGDKDGRDNGQDLHHLVQPVADAGEVNIEHPRDHLTEVLHGVKYLNDVVVEVAEINAG